MQKNKMIVITGATCCGKTIISNRILKLIRGIEKFITSTTRNPRSGEAHGVHYWFRHLIAFKEFIEKGKLFEYEEVFEETYYGMEREELARVQGNHNIPLVVMDVNGAKKIMKNEEIDALIIFIDVPLEDLLKRFLKSIELGERKNDSVTPDERKKRMEMEIAAKSEFFFVVNNIDLEVAVEEVNYLIKQFTLKKEVVQVG
ncbi:MAG: hypothetical protein KBC98_01395 [Candidatus Pacebacteria bacterium]|nr:hypothetical protein [Candidatus Paceibacterota bacterium]